MQDLYTIEDNSTEVTETVVAPSTPTNHAALLNRDAPSQHPISAIEGLRAELDKIEQLKTVVSNSQGFAQYYPWSDGNPSANAIRAGRFVSLEADGGIKVYSESDEEILGVTIDNINLVNTVGFIGGKPTSDEALWSTMKHRYGLVALLGNVLVRRENDVKVGDYVMPNSDGIAKRAAIGYKVTALSEIETVPYASINFVPDGKTLARLQEQIDYLNVGMSESLRAANIESAEDLMELVNNCPNQSFAINVTKDIVIDGIIIPYGGGHLIVNEIGATLYITGRNGSVRAFHYAGTWRYGSVAIPTVEGDLKEYASSIPEYSTVHFATNAMTTGLWENASPYNTGVIYRRGSDDTIWIEVNANGTEVAYRCFYDQSNGAWSSWRRSDYATKANDTKVWNIASLGDGLNNMIDINPSSNVGVCIRGTQDGAGIKITTIYGEEIILPEYAQGTLTVNEVCDATLYLTAVTGEVFNLFRNSEGGWINGSKILSTVHISSTETLMNLVRDDTILGKSIPISIGSDEVGLVEGYGTGAEIAVFTIPAYSKGTMVKTVDTTINMVTPDGKSFTAYYDFQLDFWTAQYDEVSSAYCADNLRWDSDSASSTSSIWIESPGLYICEVFEGGNTTDCETFVFPIDGLDTDKVRTYCTDIGKIYCTGGKVTWDSGAISQVTLTKICGFSC